MNRRLSLSGILALGLLAALPLAAQEGECTDEMTIGQCFDAGVPELASPHEEVQEKPTGSLEPGGENPTAIADYLPRLAAALAAPGLSEDLPSLSFATNVPLNDGVLYNLGVTLQGALSLHNPQVSDALLEAVPESRRDGVRTRFEEEFDEFSDPQFSLSLNRESGQFGRSMRQHAEEISTLLTSLVPQSNARLREFRDLLRASLSFILPGRAGEDECANIDIMKLRLDCFAPTQRALIKIQIAEAAAEFRTQHLILRSEIERAGVLRIADLVNNQPQLAATFEWRPREEVVGPTSYALRLRSEWSPASLNRARARCGGELRAECLGSFVRDPRVQASLRRAERFWFTLDVTREERWSAPLVEDDSATFTLPSSWTFEPALGFGWYVAAGEEGPQRARLDFEVAGAFAEEDGVRTPSRVVASATYSLRMGDDVTGTAGLVWANKPEFLGDDVTRVGARFGVRYKLPSAQQ